MRGSRSIDKFINLIYQKLIYYVLYILSLSFSNPFAPHHFSR